MKPPNKGMPTDRKGRTVFAVKSIFLMGSIYIVRELASRKRNRVFSYAGYLKIMNQEKQLTG